MTDRAVPFALGKGTHLRFDRGDIEALETAFSTITGRRVGYPEFPEFLQSLTGHGLFVWRGLKMENEKGELVHVFPLNVKGSDEAADAVFSYIQDGTGQDLGAAITSAMLASGLWKPKQATAEKKEDTTAAEDTPKN